MENTELLVSWSRICFILEWLRGWLFFVIFTILCHLNYSLLCIIADICPARAPPPSGSSGLWCIHMSDLVSRWMDGYRNGWVDGWMDGWMDGWIEGWMDGWMDVSTERDMDVQMDGWMD